MTLDWEKNTAKVAKAVGKSGNRKGVSKQK